MHTVSVALATFNGSKYIAKQLESLFAQYILPSELVIVDDASTDDTVEIIRSSITRAPFPVRIYINEHRLNYRKNFIRCANYCNGDFIFFCDQDDIWDRDKINTVIKTFVCDDDLLLVYHNAHIYVDPKNVGLLYKSSKGGLDNIISPNNIYQSPLGFCIAFRRGLLSYSDLHELSRDPNNSGNLEAHDQWFYFLSQSLGSVSYINFPLVQYRQHGENVYGVGKSKGRFLIFLEGLSQTTTRQRYLWHSSARRLEVLKAIRLRSGVNSLSVLDTQIMRYTRITLLLRYRFHLYSSKPMSRRIAMLFCLIRRSAYSSNTLGINFRYSGLYKDIVFGILLNRLQQKKPSIN